MRINKRINKTIAAIAITAGIGVVTSSAAFAAESGEGDGAREARIANLCERKDDIIPKLTERQANLNTRLEKLAALHQKAVDAGRDRAATKIEHWTIHVEKVLARVTQLIEKTPEWIAQHCD